MNVNSGSIKKRLLSVGLGVLVSAASTALYAHGLMESPASRNQICGVLTKPDQAANGTGAYPVVCAEAFADDFNGGYSFMSVLTHAEGRKVVQPLPDNVCGFDSETWQGGATPWDKAIDWPTNNMQSGRNEIVWNISWGPHFDDSKEFSYWITKADFVYQVGVPLSWDDFEDAPFCDLQYDDSNPTANPDIQADKDNTLFNTFCTVPAREGRHVIYGEWGRNQYTYERFHGCVDAQFTDTGVTTVDAQISATPDVDSVTGAGTMSFSGATSVGDGLSYQWSVSGGDSSLYSLSSESSQNTVLSYEQPSVAANITVLLTVTDGASSDTHSVTFEHLPNTTTATWVLNSSITASARELTEGDTVSVRVVDNNGNDSYLPTTALSIDSANSAADIWPYQLAQAVGDNGDIALGVLGEDGQVSAVYSATENNIYTRVGADIAGVFLTVDSPIVSTGNCEFIVANEWNSGYVANIRITNNGTTAIDGWQVSWTLNASEITNLWNANLTQGTPNSASNLGWNGSIQPGEYVEFGFGANKNTANTDAEIPVISGVMCN